MGVREIKEYIIDCDFCNACSSPIKTSTTYSVDDGKFKQHLPKGWSEIREVTEYSEYVLRMPYVRYKCGYCILKDEQAAILKDV